MWANLALELRSVCGSDAIQTHEVNRVEDSTSRLSQLALGLRSNTSDQGMLFGERSFLGPNCRTKKEQTGGVNRAEANSCNRFVSAHISGSLPVHVEVSNRIYY